MSLNIDRNEKKRVVIIGGGFAGIKLARSLDTKLYQVILVDKNNYHQFPPLIYQIATAGLNPSSISFPIRKLFEKKKDLHFRMAEFRTIIPEDNIIQTSIGKIDYDYLIFANGSKTNYFGNQNIQEAAIPMKTVSDAMGLRNSLLASFERAVTCSTQEERDALLNIVVVGGGPSGVEIAGAIAEMKHYILPHDYPDMDTSIVKISLIQGSDRLLQAMSEKASTKSQKFLEKMGVKIRLNTLVTDYINDKVILNDGTSIPTRNLIWVGGVTAELVQGLPKDCIGRGGRIITDEFCRVKGQNNIFAIGDIALMQGGDPQYPQGHPQMAQPAIQQGALLANNLNKLAKGKDIKPFRYRDLGSMATIGKNKAVADLGKLKFAGFFAWLLWMGVHLVSILGVKNKVLVFIDWIWSYFTYDKSNRMILKPFKSLSFKELEAYAKNNHLGNEDSEKKEASSNNNM